VRDFAVTIVITALSLVALGRPDIGVLTWTWVSMMNPHRMTWGFAYELQVAMVVAIATFIGLLFYRGRKRIPWSAPVVFLLLFDLWMVVTHFAGFHPELVEDKALSILKIQLMVFMTILLLHARWHINWFVGVVVFSIAFFGVKGGIFTITSGGSFTVWGPPDSALEGNNEIALALIMTIPLMYYFHTIAASRWARRGLVVAMILCAAAALGSQSRGALLALVSMSAFLWVRSPKKVVVAVALLLAGVVLIGLMPSTWESRMQTITEYQEDLSALQRLDVWRLTWNIAIANPVTGGGYGIYTEDINAIYNPNAIGGLRNAHSIYFAVVGEHGFVGLALFLGIWISVWRSCARVRKLTDGMADWSWAFWLASMLQVSLIGYLVGGAFLYLAYADFPYNLLIAAVILLDHVKRELGDATAEPARQVVMPNSMDAEPTR
jgi:probable O-glycosylation ligase (exosortase A-associated)